MAMDFIGLSVGMGYTDETVIGGGAIKGKNCVISNIEEVADGINVTFQWTLDNGTVQIETVLLPKGTQGEDGVDGKSAYQYAKDGGYIGTETEFTTNIARSGVISKELEVERARIDNLTTLQDGSTSGDAELIDLRVGYDGKTYNNAGESVRTQIKNLVKSVNEPIELNNTSFAVVSANIINPYASDIIIGGYINIQGEYVDNEQYVQSGFVRVNAGTKYTSNDRGSFVLWYDTAKNLIGSTASRDFANNGYAEAPLNAYYGRFLTTNMTNFIVCEGDGSVVPEYIPYYAYIPKKYVETPTVEPNDTTFFITSRNIFNKNDEDVIIGGFIDKEGNEVKNEDYNCTGFVNVKPNTVYTTSRKLVFIVFYDINKNRISYLDSKDNISYFMTPDGCYYLRMPCEPEYWETLQIEEGMTDTPYVPYVQQLDSKYLPSLNLSDLNFTSYGDSITARNGWQNHLVERYTLNHTNLGIGSTTMAYVESMEESYPSMVNANRIQAIKDSNPDILTILGGANDVVRNVSVGTSAELSKSLEEKDKTTFIGALSFLIETMLNWKPTLNIILLTTTYSNVASHNTIYTQYANAVREVGYYYGLKIADTNRESGITQFNTDTYTSDGIHPNEAGCVKIANIVASEIEDLYRID